jgi:hypothetical protein
MITKLKLLCFTNIVPPSRTLFKCRTSLCLVPCASAVRSLGLVLDSKHLFAWHLHTVTNKATGVFCNALPLRDSALTQSNKLTLYKLLIRSVLIYTAPVWSSTCSSSYFILQVIQSKCLRSVTISAVSRIPTCTTL